MRRALVIGFGVAGGAAALLVVACGGSKSNDLFKGDDDGGADATKVDASLDANGDAPTGDAASDALNDGAIDSGLLALSCDDLTDLIDGLRPQATECIPNLAADQCDLQVDDVCCPATVNKSQKGTKRVRDFVEAVAAFKAKKCVANCTAIACLTEPSKTCQEQGLGGGCVQ
jgi:hypothetical protein